MSETLPTMAPGETLDYLIDGADLLAPAETIVESDSTITVTGATKDSADFTDTAVTVWLSGATLGTLVKLNASLTTSGGRTYKRLYVIPYGEPVGMERAKAHLRIVDDESQDELIAGYITAARAWVENYTGHILVRRAFSEQRDCFGRYLELQRRPILADPAPTISYTDSAGTTQSYADGVYSIDRNPARVYPALSGWWPSVGRYGGVTINYTAGYAEGEAPEPLLQAMLLLIGYWWEQRSTVNVGYSVNEMPFAVQALCDQYRTPSL